MPCSEPQRAAGRATVDFVVDTVKPALPTPPPAAAGGPPPTSTFDMTLAEPPLSLDGDYALEPLDPYLWFNMGTGEAPFPMLDAGSEDFQNL